MGAAAQPASAEKTPTPQTFAAQQVAYAWQMVARELRHSHPELHQELGKRVRERLDADTLQDPGTEILDLQTRLHHGATAQRTTEAELLALRRTLADAVPLAGADAAGSEAELAQRRLQLLLEVANRGGRLPKPPPEDPAGIAPTRDELQAVIAGTRAFSRDEREWCVGEAMILTGFQQRPEQLLARSDADLAQLVLAGPVAET
ncbi:MAG: hypothetical protein LC715_01845 [Gammaproteobacteria bacterium]|nr:hypothetical protein [Gammaproteobacteria bacterium]